jgi:hypothetical protein
MSKVLLPDLEEKLLQNTYALIMGLSEERLIFTSWTKSKSGPR